MSSTSHRRSCPGWKEDVQPPSPLLSPFSIEDYHFAQTEDGRIFRNPILKPLLVELRIVFVRYVFVFLAGKGFAVVSTARSIYAELAFGDQFVLSFTGLMRYFSMHQSARRPSFMPIFLPSA